MSEIDIGDTIAPNSDQINADDLLIGPKTITVTAVTVAKGEQPVHIRFDGDDGRPFKPCKSMRRVIAFIWGKSSSDYIGKSMTLYLDESVTYGASKVGGVRISHISGIDRPTTVVLTVKRGQRKAYTVQPLQVAENAEFARRKKIIAQFDEDWESVRRKKIIAKLEKCATTGGDALKAEWESMSRDDRAIVGQAEIQRIKTVAESESLASQA